ncbi:MAG TPA: D-glucuronyl C5-epimerase family protein [Solirubrobacteraceae bacterium]|nr:D-glucuronyl C5-epimerase family protein [Solirubrobacteraceae bacterium]
MAGVLAVLGVFAGSAQAGTVTVFDHDGRTHVVTNRFLTGAAANPNLPAPPPPRPALPPTLPVLSLTPQTSATLARAPRAVPRRRRPKPKRHRPAPVTFPRALLRLEASGALAPAAYRSALSAWRRAIREVRRLGGWRATQLEDVITTLQEMAAARRVTPARLPVLLLTLANNASYWRSGPPLANGAAVQFQGSELVWEYYAGSGIQLQVLHTFGEGDGYYEAGPADYPKLVTLMSEMVPLAVRRAGGLAWEYYFNWEGGRPPWVSAMAQATGLEALTNAYLATGNAQYLAVAHQALPLLEAHPPAGVALATPLGTRFLQYSFTPQTDIINAFLQTLLGLYDYQQVSQDPVASALYNAGNRQAQAELSSFVVPGWSLYQPGEPDPVGYHELVTGFLRLLCAKTQTPVYCATYQEFAADLLTRPQLTLLTTDATAGRRFRLRFRLTKYAAVGVTLARAGRNYLYTKRSFLGGPGGFSAPKLRPGTYSLTMSVTDPVGHYAALRTTLQVCRRDCAPSPYALAPPTTGAVPTVTVPLPPPSTTPTPVSTTPTTTTTTTTTTSTTTSTTTTTTTTTGTTSAPPPSTPPTSPPTTTTGGVAP